MVFSHSRYITISNENDFMAHTPISNLLTNDETPLNSHSLGRMSWSVLHTIAVNYPHHPTIEEQNTMMSFFMNFAKVYPCWKCRDHFLKNIMKYPPQVQSQSELIHWLCFQHNLVNQKLNKPIFDCEKSNYEARWKA